MDGCGLFHLSFLRFPLPLSLPLSLSVHLLQGLQRSLTQLRRELKQLSRAEAPAVPAPSPVAALLHALLSELRLQHVELVAVARHLAAAIDLERSHTDLLTGRLQALPPEPIGSP